jgi:hypothetical protein
MSPLWSASADVQIISILDVGDPDYVSLVRYLAFYDFSGAKVH